VIVVGLLEGDYMGVITLRWVGGNLMVGTDTHNHSIVVGRSPDNADEFLGMKPSDLLLVSAAACSSYDVLEILAKQREPLVDFKVLCSGDQMSDPPYTFTHVHIHYIIYGLVNEDKLKKAIQLSEDKYCSVISTLRLGVPVTSDYEIIQR
jgi:putative redox protein